MSDMTTNHSMEIRSVHNPKIRWLMQLAKPRVRRAEQVFVIEGFREIRLARAAGYAFQDVFWCPAVSSRNPVREWLDTLPAATPIHVVSAEIFAKIAYRDNVDGVLVVAQTRTLCLDALQLPAQPLVIVLEAVEKPGNLGAILRTADAAQVDAVLLGDPHTDVYNPNVVRSSVGCLFTCPLAVDTSVRVQTFLRHHGMAIYAAALTGAQPYHLTDFTRPCAIVLGTEAQGLSDLWLTGADCQIKIPMLGQADSLNVSTSAAILIYEARRQRGF